jgi:putative copper resistance protein D
MHMAGPPVWLVLSRGAHDAAVLSFLGSLGFAPLVLPRDFTARMSAPLRRLAGISGAAALLFGIIWFLASTAMVTGAQGIAAAVTAVPAFIAYVPFGQVLLLRLALIAVALAVLGWPPTSLVLAALAVALQPFLGHAAQVGAGPVASEILHLLAAGLWLGGLVPLLLGLRLLPLREAVQALRRFTRVGLGAVLLLAGTGLAQGVVLAGGIPGLLHTAYGHVALLKALLFTLAILFAVCNRLILTPRLIRSPSVSVLLQFSIAIEALIGAAIVFAAGWLANLPPA